MTLKELESRVDRIRSKHLMVLARTPDGQEQVMSVKECIEANADFIRVVSGNDLHDLDELLDYEIGGVCAIN